MASKNKFLLEIKDEENNIKLKRIMEALIDSGYNPSKTKVFSSSTCYLSIDPFSKSIIPWQNVAASTIAKRATVDVDYCSYIELKLLVATVIMIGSGINLHFNGKCLVNDDKKESFIDQYASNMDLNMSVLRNSFSILNVVTDEISVYGFSIMTKDFGKIVGCSFEQFVKEAHVDERVKVDKGKIEFSNKTQSVSVSKQLLEQMCDLEYRHIQRDFERAGSNYLRRNPTNSYCEQTLNVPMLDFSMGASKYSISEKGVIRKN